MSKTVREILSALNGQIFASRRAAEEAMAAEFKRHRSEFDPDYSLYQFLQWAYRSDWITQVDGTDEFLIQAELTQRAVFA